MFRLLLLLCFFLVINCFPKSYIFKGFYYDQPIEEIKKMDIGIDVTSKMKGVSNQYVFYAKDLFYEGIKFGAIFFHHENNKLKSVQIAKTNTKSENELYTYMNQLMIHHSKNNLAISSRDFERNEVDGIKNIFNDIKNNTDTSKLADFIEDSMVNGDYVEIFYAPKHNEILKQYKPKNNEEYLEHLADDELLIWSTYSKKDKKYFMTIWFYNKQGSKKE